MPSATRKNDPRIIVALDYHSREDARKLIAQLDPKLCRLKIGSIMFTHFGPAFVKEITEQGFEVFLDLKFHDIPQTVAGACYAAAELGVWMLNVHTQGGEAMLSAAVAELKKFPQEKRPLIIAVTVLTSLESNDLKTMGIQEDLPTLVLNMAKKAKEMHLDGIVCSAQEAPLIRQHLGKDFLLVTPGIRLSSDAANDQKRIVTPDQAIQMGASYLVIGRPITHAENPYQVLQQITHDLERLPERT